MVPRPYENATPHILSALRTGPEKRGSTMGSGVTRFDGRVCTVLGNEPPSTCGPADRSCATSRASRSRSASISTSRSSRCRCSRRISICSTCRASRCRAARRQRSSGRVRSPAMCATSPTSRRSASSREQAGDGRVPSRGQCRRGYRHAGNGATKPRVRQFFLPEGGRPQCSPEHFQQVHGLVRMQPSRVSTLLRCQRGSPRPSGVDALTTERIGREQISPLVADGCTDSRSPPVTAPFVAVRRRLQFTL